MCCSPRREPRSARPSAISRPPRSGPGRTAVWISTYAKACSAARRGRAASDAAERGPDRDPQGPEIISACSTSRMRSGRLCRAAAAQLAALGGTRAATWSAAICNWLFSAPPRRRGSAADRRGDASMPAARTTGALHRGGPLSAGRRLVIANHALVMVNARPARGGRRADRVRRGITLRRRDSTFAAASPARRRSNSPLDRRPRKRARGRRRGLAAPDRRRLLRRNRRWRSTAVQMAGALPGAAGCSGSPRHRLRARRGLLAAVRHRLCRHPGCRLRPPRPLAARPVWSGGRARRRGAGALLRPLVRSAKGSKRCSRMRPAADAGPRPGRRGDRRAHQRVQILSYGSRWRRGSAGRPTDFVDWLAVGGSRARGL